MAPDKLQSIKSQEIHLEGLREEALDLTGAGDCQLILLRKLIHTQNGNDILWDVSHWGQA